MLWRNFSLSAWHFPQHVPRGTLRTASLSHNISLNCEINSYACAAIEVDGGPSVPGGRFPAMVAGQGLSLVKRGWRSRRHPPTWVLRLATLILFEAAEGGRACGYLILRQRIGDQFFRATGLLQ